MQDVEQGCFYYGRKYVLNNFSGLILEIRFFIGILYQTNRTAKKTDIC